MSIENYQSNTQSITCQNNEIWTRPRIPVKKDCGAITDSNGKILKNSENLNKLLKITNWKNLKKIVNEK